MLNVCIIMIGTLLGHQAQSRAVLTRHPGKILGNGDLHPLLVSPHCTLQTRPWLSPACRNLQHSGGPCLYPSLGLLGSRTWTPVLFL